MRRSPDLPPSGKGTHTHTAPDRREMSMLLLASPRNELVMLFDLCVSSLRRGHAKLLCIVPLLTDGPRKESSQETILQNKSDSSVQEFTPMDGHAAMPEGFFLFFTDTARNLKASRMACAQSPKHQRMKPGLPRDRRKYWRKYILPRICWQCIRCQLSSVPSF